MTSDGGSSSSPLLDQFKAAAEANPAREIGRYLAAELNAHRLTTGDLTAWRPEPKRARKPGKRRTRAAEVPEPTPEQP